MNDHELWQHGIEKCRELRDSVESSIKPEYARLLERIICCKSELMEGVRFSGGSAICTECGGECCLHGKYHLTPADILAYLQRGETTIYPNFSCRPHCPYSNSSGCLMSGEMRPVTCIIFNCNLLERSFGDETKRAMGQLEHELRQTISHLNKLLGMRIDRPLLLWSSEQK